jgi:hypothetical protein
MELMTVAAVPQNDRDVVFHYSRGRALFGFLTLAVCAIGLIIFGRLNHAWIAYYVAVALILVLLIFQKLLTARFRPTNWLVRLTDTGLFIKFRSYLNDHFPVHDPTVVFIPYSEIRTAKLVQQRREIPNSDRNRRSSTVRLCRTVELEIAHARPLAAVLAAEAKLVFGRTSHSARRISTRYQHLPVQLDSTDLLRIEWGVVPSAAKLMELLSGHTLVQTAASTSVDFVDLDRLSREEQESRLLELAQSGETIAAIALARRLYGYDLTKAKEFVESLAGGEPTQAKP